MDDKSQDVRVPGNAGNGDPTQQSASVSFGQVIPTSISAPGMAQTTAPVPQVQETPAIAPTPPPVAQPTPIPVAPAQPIITPVPTVQPGFTQTPVEPPKTKPVMPRGPKLNLNWKKIARIGGIIILIIAVIIGITLVVMNLLVKKDDGQVLNASRFNTIQIPLDDLADQDGIALLGTRSLIINGPLRANDAFIISPSAQPSNAARGQIYFDQTNNQLAYFNGTRFVPVTDNNNAVQSIDGLTGQLALGSGLDGANGQITNTGVLSVQGQTGNITFTAGPGIVVDGTTITNAGVTSFGGRVGAITVGNGLNITDSGELQNTGVTSATGGAGISVTDDGSGNITISNTGAGTGTVQSPGGTAGRIAKFTGVQTIEDSLLSETGSVVTVNGDLTITGALNLSTALPVGSGGTGATSLANNGVVIGQGSGALTAVTAGGAGLCLISTAGAPSFQACPGGASVVSVNGLTGALTIANATGAGTTITINDASTSQKGIAQFNGTNFTAASGIINTVQDISVAAAPTFGRLTLTSSQATSPMLLVNNTNGTGTGNLIDLQVNGVSRMAISPAGNMTLTGTLNGQTISNTASFTGTLNVTGATTLGNTLNVNGAANLNGGATVTGTLTANTITPTGAMTIGAANQSLTLQGNGSTTLSAASGANTTTVSFQSPTANVNYRLLTAAAGTYDICTTAGNCVGIGGGVTTTGGTANQLAKFNGSNSIVNSIISDNGSTVSIAGALAVNTITPSGALTIGAIAQNLTLQGASTSLSSTSGGVTNTVSFATPSGGNKSIIVPNASGTVVVSASGPLAIDANGNITCPTCAVSGSGVTSLNGLTGALSIANASGAGSTVTINDASTSQKGIAQFNGTNFSTAGGIVNTIQDIAVTATPTFGALTLTSSQATSPMLLVNNTNGSSTGNLIDLQLNGASRLAVSPAGNMTLTGTINGQTISSAANLTGTLTVAGGTTLNDTLDVNGAANLNNGATVTGTLTANVITPTGAMTIGATNQSISVQGNASSTFSATGGANTTTLAFQTPTANVTYRLLTAAAGTYDICTTAGNCAGVGGGVTTSGGTANQLAKFNGSNSIVDSIISDNGTTVSIGGTLAVNTITPTGAMTIGATGQNLLLQGATTTITATNGGVTNSLVFAAPAGGNKTITIPNATGTVAVSASGPIVLDANGNISCPTCSLSGSGVTSLNGLTGALSIANASGVGSTITIQDASTSQKGIAQFNSTNFTAASGVVNTIQNISVAATPTFGTLTLTSSQATSPMLLVNNTNGSGTGNLIDLQLNGASRMSVSPAGNMTLTGTVNGQTISSAASFTGTLNVTGATTLGNALNVTGAANLNGGATVTGTLTANTITPTGAMTIGATNQSLTLQGNASSTFTATSGANTTTLAFQTPTANVTYRLLTAAAGTYDICTTAGNCAGVGGGVTTAGGTINTIPKFTGAQTIGNSIITDNGTTVSIGGVLAVNTITPTGALTIGATSQNLSLQGASTSLSSTSGGFTNTLAFATPSGSNKTITVPNASGTVAVSASGPITLDAAGNIACPTCALAGSGVTSLNGLTGALSIANASGAGSTITIQDASTSQKGIAQFNNTNFTAASGVINTVQNINVAAAPTFGALTLTSSQATSPMLLVNNTNASGTGNLIDLQSNGASRMSVSPAGNMTVSGTVNGQTISSTANFTGTLTVASLATLSGGATVGGTLTANTITPTGAMTVGATGQSLTLQGNASTALSATSGANTTTLNFQTPTANVTYRLLTAAAGTYDICTTAGNCSGVGGGVTTSGGTTNAIPKFTSAQTIGDSIITDNGTTVSIGGVLAVNTITPTGTLTIGATSQNLSLQGAATSLSSTSGGFTNTFTFATPAGSNKTITVPNASGTVAVSASGPITLDAAGNIACPTCALTGSGVTSLNGLTGALSIANASGAGSIITIQDASTSQKGIAQFNGTNFSVTGGVVNTIQDIAVSSAPTFGRLTVTSSQASNAMLLINNTNVSATGNLLDVQLNGSSRLAVSPAGNMTLVGTLNGQTISSAANLTGTLAVAGLASLNGGATVTGTLTANTITPTSALTVGATTQSFLMQGNTSSTITATNGANTTTVAFQSPTASVTYRLLTAAAGTYDICTTAGNCSGVGGGVTTPGGTAGALAKFTSSGTIADSIVTESGSTITIGGTLAVNTITPAAAMTIGAVGQDLTLQGADTTISASDAGITNSLTFATPAGSNKTIVLPNASGTVAVSASGPLAIDANGNITCATCATTGGGPGPGAVVDSLNGLTGALTIANASGVGTTVTINDASTSQKGIAQFNNTNFTAASGAVNTIQDINTTATPTFGRLTVTSSQASNAMLLVNNTNGSGSGNLIDLQLNGSSRMSVSPAGAMTLVGNLNGQTISSAANFTGTLAVAGLASLNGGATVTGTLTANNLTPTSALTVGATNQSFLVQGSSGSTITATNAANTTALAFQTPTANVTYRFLTAAAGTYDICTTAGNCAGVGGGVTTVGGTTNQLAKFTGASTIGDSSISDDGSTVTIGGTLAVNTLTPTAALTIGAAAQNLTLQGATVNLRSTSGGITNSLTFATPAGSNKTITVPNASGTLVVSASGPLAIDTAGNITCATCAIAGSGVTSLNSLTGALTIANASGTGSTVTINDASTAQKGIAQFNSTNFTAASGTINTIQNINTTATPTFGRLTVTSSQAASAMFLVNNTNASGTGNLIDLQLNGASRLAVSPAGNMTLVGTLNGQTISSAASLTGTLAVAGLASLNGGATVTGTLTANNLTPTGALTVGATNQSFLVQGSATSTITATSGANTTTLAFQTPGANVTYRFLTSFGGTYDVCTTAGNCVGAGGGVTTAGGTINTIPKFTGTSTIGNSSITDNGTTVTIGGTLAVNTLTPTAALTVGAVAQNLTLQGAAVNLTSTAGGFTNSLTFATPAGSNKTITVPNASGTLVVSASGPLAIDAAGNITCATCAVAGSGVASLNGLTGALNIANASGTGSTVTIDDASTSQKGIAQFSNTNFSASAGVINTIQDINSTAAPQFGQLTLTSSQASAAMLTVNNTNVSAAGNLIDLQLNGSSRMSVSPAGAMTLTGTLNGQTISSTANLTGTLAVAGLASLNGGATVTGTLTANTITPTGALTVGATSQNFTLQGAASSTITATSGANTTTLAFQTPTANVTYRLLTAAAGTYDICTTVGNCAGVGGGVTTAGGTTGTIAKFTSSGSIGDSLLSESGSIVTVAGTLRATTAVQAPLIDTATAAALNIGTTNATAINLNQSTNVVGNLDVSGSLAVGSADQFQVNASGNLTTTGTGAFQGGTLSVGTAAQAGNLALFDGSSNTATLQVASLSVDRAITFGDEAGTVCLQNSTNCGFAAASGSANYIQNQNSGDQTANFRISGSGRANTSFLTPLLDTAAAGTLTLGGTATAIALNENTTVTGNLNQSTGTFSLASNGTGSATSTGALTITGGAASTWSTSAGNLTVQAATTSTLNLQTGGAGTVAVGDVNSTTIYIGRGSNIARTIRIGDTTGGSAAQTISIGNNGASSTTIIKGGGGITINATTGAYSLQGISTSTLAGTSGSFTTTFGFTTPTANTTINLPALTAGTYTVCTSSGNCSGAATTLQTAYNASTNPELTLDATRGALTVRDASVALGANLLEVQNNAGSTTYFAVTAAGTSTNGTITATGNINSSNGALMTSGITRIDIGGNATNIGSIVLSSAIMGGTTYTGSGNINTTGGALQTNTTNRIDNSGNLVNIGNITGTGAITIASSGAGNDVIVNGADAFIVQDASQFTSTLQVDGAATFNTDVTLALADAENLEITNTITGTNDVALVYTGLVNNTSSGTQRGQLIQNIGGTGTTEALLMLDNADIDTVVTTGLAITSAAGTIQNGIDASDADLVNALLFGANDIVGTNLTVTGATGNLTTAGDLAVNGGDITSTGTLNITPGGALTIGATGQAFTLQGNASSIITATGGGFTTTIGFTGTPIGTTVFQFDRSVSPGTYQICTTAGNCTSVGATLQGAYDGGNTINTTNGRDIAFNLTDTATDASFLVNLQCDTGCNSNGRFAIQDDGVDVFTISPAGGAALYQASVDTTTSFNIKNAAGSNFFTADTLNSRIGINLGSNWTPSLLNEGIEINGAFRMSGTIIDHFLTPGGANVNTRFGISVSDPGSFGQLFAMGLSATAQNNARGMSLFDARPGVHQPTLAVFSPDENGAIGFTWNGSNTTARLQTIDETSASDGIIISSGNINNNGATGDVQINTGNATSGTNSTGDIYVVSGSGGSGNTTTGDVVIDSGVKSGSGTNGIVQLAASNASALILGRTGLTTSNAGGLAVTQSFSVGDNVTLGDANTDTVTVNGVIQGSTPFVFEGGAADASELSLAVAALTGDRTVTLGDESGTVCLQNSANCGFIVGSGTALLQNGNTFGAALTIGTNDANGINLEVNNTTVATLSNTGAATFQNSTNSTAAFRILNQAGTTNVFVADTNNGRVGVNTAAPSERVTVNGNINVRDSDTPTKQYRFRTNGGSLDFEGGGADLYISVFQNGNLSGTQNNKLILQNSAITQAIATWQFRDTAHGAVRHLIDAATGGNVVLNEDGQATDFRVEADTDTNALFVQGTTNRVGVGTNTPAAKLQILSTAAEPLFRITDGTATAVDVLNIADEGAVTFRTRTDNINGFVIQDSTATALFNVDTINNRVYIGNPTADSVGALLVLDTKNTTGDPTGVLGGMYYNSALQQFRCFRAVSSTPGDGLWEACGTEPIDRGWSVSDEFLGGSWDSGVVGELGWTNDFQSGGPTLDYNVGMSGAVADRPGVIEINTSAVLNAGVTLTLDRDSQGSVTLAAGNVVKTTAGLDSTLTNAIFRTGLHNEGANNSRPSAGVWWEAAPSTSARWQFCYAVSGAPVCSNASNTTPTIVTGQWYRLEIRIISVGAGTSQIDFYIDGQKFTASGTTLTTTTKVRPAMACWNSIAAQRFCNIDYFQFSGTASAAR